MSQEVDDKHEYWVVGPESNAGRGRGRILLIRARDPEEIRERFPEVSILEKPLDGMTEDVQRIVRERDTYDIDDPPRGYLLKIIQHRGKPGLIELD